MLTLPRIFDSRINLRLGLSLRHFGLTKRLFGKFHGFPGIAIGLGFLGLFQEFAGVAPQVIHFLGDLHFFLCICHHIFLRRATAGTADKAANSKYQSTGYNNFFHSILLQSTKSFLVSANPKALVRARQPVSQGGARAIICCEHAKNMPMGFTPN